MQNTKASVQMKCSTEDRSSD